MEMYVFDFVVMPSAQKNVLYFYGGSNKWKKSQFIIEQQ